MSTWKWVVGLIALIVVLLLAFGKRLKRWFQSILGVNLGFDTLDDGQSSMSFEKAKQIADELYSAMFGLGTDENKIYMLLGDLSNHDFNKVYNVFGRRRTTNNIFVGKDMDLWQWLRDELSSGELEKLKELNPEIFV